MVLLRLTVKIPPPEVVQHRRRSTNSTAQGKPTSFLLVIRNPEQTTLGELTWLITEKWSKLRPDAGPLQIKKLLDDEHDTHDLDLELTAADVFVDNGKAARDGLDQRATVRVVQAPSTKAPFRYGSVVQDWNAVSDHYARVNASRPRPPVPLFPGLEQSQRGLASGRVLPSVTEVNPPSFAAPVPEVAESVYNDGDNDIDRRRGEMSPVLGDDPGPPAPRSPGRILIPSLASKVRLSLDAQSAALRGLGQAQQEKPGTRRRSSRVSLIDRLSISKDDLSPSSKAATRGAKRRRSSFKPSELRDSPPAKKQNTSKTPQERHKPSPTVSVVITQPAEITAPARGITPALPTQAPQAQSNHESLPDSISEPARESGPDSDPETVAEVHSKSSPEPIPQSSSARHRQPSPVLNREPSPEYSAAHDEPSPALSSRGQTPGDKEAEKRDRVEQEVHAAAQPELPERPSTPCQRPSTKYPLPFISANELLPSGNKPGAPVPPAETNSTHDDSPRGPTARSKMPDELGGDPMEVDSPPPAKTEAMDSAQTAGEDFPVDDMEPETESLAKTPQQDVAGPVVEELNVTEPIAAEPSVDESRLEDSDIAQSSAAEAAAQESNAGRSDLEGSKAEELKAIGSGASDSSGYGCTSESSAAEQSPVEATPPRCPAKRRLSTQGVERVDLSPEAAKSPRPGPGPRQMGLGITASPPKPRRRQISKRQGMSMMEMERHTNGKTPSPPLSQRTGNSAAAVNGSSKVTDSGSGTSDHSDLESELSLRRQIKLAQGRRKPVRVVRQMEEILGLIRELRAAKKNNRNTLAARLQKQLDKRNRALEEQGDKTQAEKDVSNGDSHPEIPSTFGDPSKTSLASANGPTLLPSPIINTQSSSYGSSKSSREDVPLVRGRKLNITPVSPRARKIHGKSVTDGEQQGDKFPVVKKEAQSSEYVEQSPNHSSESSSSSNSDANSDVKKPQANWASEFDSDAESAFEDLSTPADPTAKTKPSEESPASSQSSSSEDEELEQPNKQVVKPRPKINGKVNTVDSSSSDSDLDSDESTGGDIPFRPLKKTEPETVATANTTRPRTRGLGRARNAARLQTTTPQPQPASSPFAERERSLFNTFSQPARRQSSVASVATPGRRPRTNLKELMSTMKRT